MDIIKGSTGNYRVYHEGELVCSIRANRIHPRDKADGWVVLDHNTGDSTMAPSLEAAKEDALALINK